MGVGGTSGGITYEWTKTIKTASTTVTQAGTHNVYVTDATTGCKGTASAIAAPKATVSAFILGNNNCGNSVLTVIAPTLGAGGTGGSYLWSNGATTADITVTSAGAYSATVSSAEGCTAVTSTEVTPKVIPTASIAVTDNCGNSVLSASTTPPLGVGGTYLWSNGETTSDITLIATGVGGAATYTVTLTNSEDCSTTVSSTATLKIDPTIYMVTGGGTYCAGLEGLEVGLSGSQTGVSYQIQKYNVNVGTAITGTGAAISFGKQMEAGTYSVIGTHIISACMNTMLSPKTIVIDETLPAFVAASVPANISINCSDAIPSAATPSATNSCSTVSMSETSTKGTDATQCNFYSYAITRTWTATDKRSNTATVSQVITVTNKIAPTFGTVNDVTVTEILIPTTVPFTLNSCSTPATLSFTETRTDLTPLACQTYQYILNRVWTLTDICGNTSTKTQKITARGITLTCPSDKIIYTDSDGTNNYNCSTLITASMGVAPAFTDGCDLSVLRFNITGATLGNGSGTVAGVVFNKGISKISYSLVSNVADECSFNITVLDNEAPKITVATPTVVIDNTCDFPTTLPNQPMTSDNCSGATPTLSIVSDVTADLSSTCASKAATSKYTKRLIRTWSATDGANSATRTQTFYLRDMIAPTANCRQNVVITFGTLSTISRPAADFNNGSMDECTGALSFKACRGSACTNFGTNITFTKTMIPTGQNMATVTVLLRVYDACGNASNCMANVLLKRTATSTLANTNTPSEATLAETSDAITANTPSVPSDVNAAHGSLKCFPNPFTEDLNLQYNLTEDVSTVTLKVYDNQGRVVAKNEQGESPAGFYQMRWNLSDLAAAMYHICLEIDGKCVKTERVVLLK